MPGVCKLSLSTRSLAEGKILKNCIKEGSKTVYSNLRTIKIRNI